MTSNFKYRNSKSFRSKAPWTIDLFTKSSKKQKVEVFWNWKGKNEIWGKCNVSCLIYKIILEWQKTKQPLPEYKTFSPSTGSERNATMNPSELISPPFKSNPYFLFRPNNLFESVIPIFNHDGNYFTPAFVLKK